MHVVSLKDNLALSSSVVGGKGASLAAISTLNIPSPNGFCITSDVFSSLVSDLDISDLLELASDDSTVLNDDVLLSIRSKIMSADINPVLEKEIKEQYIGLENQALNTPLKVAVRSSATSEDSLAASFAGQHDTFLNISGIVNVIESTKKCWASYWSKRAYYYRKQKGIDHLGGAMAVVIQEFLPANSSGIMFTINPVTNNSNEVVIESCWGLGELIVSGRVTPDSYFVNNSTDTSPSITKKVIKSKKRMITPDQTSGNGTSVVETSNDISDMQVISDATIIELVNIGKVLSKHFGHALDIEWAFYNGCIYILQSRPITTI